MPRIDRTCPNVAFYNFEHPEGAGVLIASDSSTPQVYFRLETGINLRSEFMILESNRRIMHDKLYSGFKVIKISTLKHNLRRTNKKFYSNSFKRPSLLGLFLF